MYIVGLIIFFAIATMGFWWPIVFFSKDKEKMKPDCSLDPDAVIVGVSRKKVGLKGDYRIQTTVEFSDGYKYIAFDTERNNRFLGYTISVSSAINDSIVNRAVVAHDNRCRLK